MDYYISSGSGAVSGPHSIQYLQNKASSGGLGANDRIARVPEGTSPEEDQFVPFEAAVVTRWRRSFLEETVAPSGSEEETRGGLLRLLGWAVAVVGVIAGMMSLGDDAAYGLAVMLSAIVSGAVLWGLGAILQEVTRR